jgi:predicted Fe-Mo cluster-binding NifX family protein
MCEFDEIWWCVGWGGHNLGRPLLAGLRAGVDLEKQKYNPEISAWRTLLQRATEGNSIHHVKLLIEYGANVNAVSDGDRRTPLHIASTKSRGGETVKMLLDAGAVVDERNYVEGLHSNTTPLMSASGIGYSSAVELLISNGADVNAVTSLGYTSLHFAICGCNLDIVAMLINNGADMTAVTNNGENVDDMIGWIYERYPEKAVLIEAEIERARAPLREAFAMGNHERLGARSLVQWLSAEEMRMVFEQM